MDELWYTVRLSTTAVPMGVDMELHLPVKQAGDRGKTSLYPQHI